MTTDGSNGDRAPAGSRFSHPFARGLRASGRGQALVLLEYSAAGFFAAGVAQYAFGQAAGWVLLSAVLIACAARAVELEGCALFVSGGLYGIVRDAFGPAVATVAASVLIVEYLLLGALAASGAGHALAIPLELVSRAAGASFQVTVNDISTAVAACLIAAVWSWRRQGRSLADVPTARAVVSIAAAAAVLIFFCAASVLGRHAAWEPLTQGGAGQFSIVSWLSAVGSCLFVIGSGEALGRASIFLPQPRIRSVARAAWFISGYSLVLTAGSGFLFLAIVPSADQALWRDAPLTALAWFCTRSGVAGFLLVAAVASASAVLLGLAVHESAVGTHGILLRLSEDGGLSPSVRRLHPRFGTASRLVGLIAVGQLAVLLLGAAQLTWLARAFAIAAVCNLVLKIGALVRMRALRPDPLAFRVPFNVRIGDREWPAGLIGIGLLAAIPTAVWLATGDLTAWGVLALLVVLSEVLAVSRRAARESTTPPVAPTRDADLLPAPVIGADHLAVRPRNALVAVRKPGALAHLVDALQSAGDRDVVVMTVRLVGVDVSENKALDAGMTDAERRVFRDAAMLAERYERAVRLLIVPATSVTDAIADTIVQLRSSEVYVGESETLTVDDQARMLGDAWERTSKPEAFEVRLVTRQRGGRTGVYYLGAHTPALTTDDLQLIHALWLDLVKTVGPHVHHHDVVRAALKHMQEQLSTDGPARDAVVDLVARNARPADELASAVHQRDFARLRELVRNRVPSELAALFGDLSLEDQVVIFRVLPRKLAAQTFEYLSPEAQRALLKTMAQEDVAAILNFMAPDDRTMFLEELPASATQQLLALLTPEERAVAVTLLGYPEGSIGRLMTPDYIAVRESWTIQEVLDYVRAHGHDSETLNVIYVVDDRGALIDDIRIREVLLTSPANHVHDLMDRRFISLSASADQSSAVALFRREDRSALPVTDSTGVLIGIVTIDDVLDVAEAEATKDIQQIGGSEALDEPYMRIAFSRMIQKRAGWLTALFIGEMLTATAMGAFEREIERAVVLALFVPLIISSGGNSGSQASTLVIRAIALGEVQLKDWWRVMRREIGAGVALGAILGTIGVLRITIWSAFSTIYGPHWPLVAMTVGIALVGVVLWGTLVGSLLPFLLRRLGFDPAASSAPFVATLVDVTGLIIYFTVGMVVLHGSLL